MHSFLISQQAVHIFTIVLQVAKRRKSTPFQSIPVKISETRLSTRGSHTATVRRHKLHTVKLHVTDGRGKWTGQNLKIGSHLNVN